MATVDEAGGITLNNEEAVFMALCCSLSQAVVLGRADLIPLAAQALKSYLLETDFNPSNLNDEISKCVNTSSRYTTVVVKSSVEDLLQTEVTGAVNIDNTPLATPTKGKTGTGNPNLN